MSKFLKIPISPLMGSSILNYIKVILSNKVDIKFYLHVFLTFIVVLLISPFQLIDRFIFFFKRNNQKKRDPIFIIGHWRSGTTLLHNLLSLNKNFGFFNTYNSLFINNIYSSLLFKTLMKYTMPKERPSDKIKLDVELPQEDEFAVSNYTNISHYNFFFFPNDYKKFYSEAIRFEKNNEKLWLSKYSDILKLPHNLNGFFDYDQAIQYAKKENKPVLLDFTGHGCVNCRDIESRVWPDERVRDYLNNKYVLLSLYVDDKTELSREQWYTSKYDSKIKKTIGKQNADFQITRFNNNAQPFYVILDPFSEKVIYKPWGYELDIENYLSHLSNGIKTFYEL